MSRKDPQGSRVPKKLSRKKVDVAERDPRLVWLGLAVLAALIAAGWTMLFLTY